MSWTTVEEIKAQLRRRWERGEWLRGRMDGGAVFPLRLRLSGPGPAEWAGRYEEVRGWIAELAAFPQIRIEWRELHHRVLGWQRVPQSVWIDSREDALEAVGKWSEAARFDQLLELTRARQPGLLAWLERRPLQALGLAAEWERLLAVVAWVRQHPRPGLYLRQVDLPGIDSKFIEAHRGVLAEWLELALPPEAIAAESTGTGRFSARFGFREKPVRIRFRVLDAGLGLLRGVSRPDITLDAASFAALEAPIRRVFITENEVNFLAFPPAAEAIVIFGAGYGWEALAGARWLAGCTMHYWGDIDTHGFAILDQLRGRFAQVASFLMDRETLMAHEAMWGEEAQQVGHELPRLTLAERGLFDDLRYDRIRTGLRLEQERVGFAWAEAGVLQALEARMFS